MPSNFLEFNQGLPNIDKWKDPEDKIREIMNYVKQLTEQLRYEFRHIRVPKEEKERILNEVFPLSADKITEGILPTARGGTGAETAAGARENLGIGGLETVTEIEMQQTSLTTGVWKEIGSLTLGSGTWIVTLDVCFTANASGQRGISIAEELPDWNVVTGNGVMVPGATGRNNVIQFTRVIDTTGGTMRLGAYQTSGAALDMRIAKARAVRLCVK